MPTIRKTPAEKLTELEAAKDRINARIQAEKQKLAKQERKEDTREKIILGAIVLAHMEHSADFKDTVMNAICKFQEAQVGTRSIEKTAKDIEFLISRWAQRFPANEA